jgi:hypothetical protein
MTQRELLGLHAEVKALQGQFGISYKDAAHRLYHAEVQKLSALTDCEAALSEIHKGVDYIISDTVEAEPREISKKVSGDKTAL